jgi:DNA-binding transcriptional ArsR family regulator
MSSQAHRFEPGRRNEVERTALAESDLLSVLTDEKCLGVLRTLESDSLTVTELNDELDVPISTLYRKVDCLVEAGLLEEHTRFQVDGNHKNEYARTVSDVSVDVDLEALEVVVRD